METNGHMETGARLQRYRLDIEYDGTDFVGWQLQSRGRTVQGTLEDAMRLLFGTPLRVHGAGRTDTGVHATGQVAHVDAPARYDAAIIRKALNSHLPPDISVMKVADAEAEFHARFSASSREYVYTVAHERTSLDRHRSWILFSRIDHDRVREAASLLAGTHDFTSFSKFSPNVHHTYCHVFEVTWQRGDLFSRLHIKANRFLQGMVRCIMGGLMLVGRGKLSVQGFGDILAAIDRKRTPMFAPPEGLILTAVNYDPAERDIVNRAYRSIHPGD